jgi:hypothetical protein
MTSKKRNLISFKFAKLDFGFRGVCILTEACVRVFEGDFYERTQEDGIRCFCLSVEQQTISECDQ